MSKLTLDQAKGSMTSDEIRTVVKAVLHRLAPEADLERLPGDGLIREHLDIDSLDAYNFLVQLHQKFKIEIPEKDYIKLSTISGIVEYVEKALEALNAASAKNSAGV